jgi:hypothetical protein
MLTLNVTNRIIMKITVWLTPTRQRFDNCLLKKFNYRMGARDMEEVKRDREREEWGIERKNVIFYQWFSDFLFLFLVFK